MKYKDTMILLAIRYPLTDAGIAMKGESQRTSEEMKKVLLIF